MALNRTFIRNFGKIEFLRLVSDLSGTNHNEVGDSSEHTM